MNKFAIIADTTCDLGEELQQKYDIQVIPGHLVIPGGEDIFCYPRWDRSMFR